MNEAQPVGGATPPVVFSLWTKLVAVSVSPPVGPSCADLRNPDDGE